MNAPLRSQVLKLYKELLRYGEQLQLTNKEYYMKRIKKEFIKNRDLQDLADINYSYKVRNKCFQSFNMILYCFCFVERTEVTGETLDYIVKC